MKANFDRENIWALEKPLLRWGGNAHLVWKTGPLPRKWEGECTKSGGNELLHVRGGLNKIAEPDEKASRKEDHLSLLEEGRNPIPRQDIMKRAWKRIWKAIYNPDRKGTRILGGERK